MPKARRDWRTRIICCVAFLGTAAICQAAPVFVPDLPDFYQHQLSGSDPAKPFDRPANFAGYSNPTTPVYANIIPLDDGGPGIQWERNGGWCYITSFTSVFYQLDRKGASGLFDHGGNYTWLERMNYAIADFAIHAWGFGEAGPQSASQFITNKIGADRISLDLFTWDVGLSQVLRNSQPTGFDSMYTAYSNLLASGNSVVLDLTNPGPANPDWWWSSSYHMVAAAGYNDATSEVYFADPNNKGSDPSSADWGHPYAEDDPLPVGESCYNFNTMDATGLLSGSGGLGGAQVRTMYVFSVVPEPATSGMVLFGIAVSLWTLRHRRSRAGIPRKKTCAKKGLSGRLLRAEHVRMQRLPLMLLALAALSLSACCHTMNAAVAKTMCCHDKCCEKQCIGDKCPCGKCPSLTKVKLATALLPI